MGSEHIPESGEPLTMPECSRCGAQNARGTEFIRAGVRVWKCGECGKGMNNGYLEDSHKKQLESKIGHEKATENRDRFWREQQEKQSMEFEKRSEERDPNAHEAFDIGYATRRWKF